MATPHPIAFELYWLSLREAGNLLAPFIGAPLASILTRLQERLGE